MAITQYKLMEYCIVCGKKIHRSKVTNSLKMRRPLKAVTCSKKCSKIYARIYERLYINIYTNLKRKIENEYKTKKLSD